MWNCSEKSSVTLGCLENPKQPRVALRWFLTVAPFACRRSWSRRRLRKGEREISALRTHKVLNRVKTPVTTWNPKYMPVPLALFCSAKPCVAEICSTSAHQPGSVWLCHQSQANVWLLCNGTVQWDGCPKEFLRAGVSRLHKEITGRKLSGSQSFAKYWWDMIKQHRYLQKMVYSGFL